MDKYQKEVEQAKLDAELQQVKALKAEYERAAKEIQQKIKLINGKLNVLLKDFDRLDDKQRSIIQSQIYQKDYQESLKKQIDDILDGFNEKEYKSINQYLKDGYEISYTGTMYDITKQGIPLVIPIDQKAVAKALTNNTKLSVSLYKKLGINATLLNRQIQSTISRGIAMGDSYNIIARNLNNDSNVGFNRAMRIARTEGHRVQMEAANDAQHVAKDAGADIVKQWDATLDGRTRPLHRELDGQIRELDEPFEVGGLEVMYPSAFGRAAQDINCRCVITQRAKWALDDDELERLKNRAAEFGLVDENGNPISMSYLDFKNKYAEFSEGSFKELKAQLKNAEEQLALNKLEVSSLNRKIDGEEYQENEIRKCKERYKDVSTLSEKELAELKTKADVDAINESLKKLSDELYGTYDISNRPNRKEQPEMYRAWKAKREELRNQLDALYKKQAEAYEAVQKLDEYNRYLKELERIKREILTRQQLIDTINQLKKTAKRYEDDIQRLTSKIANHPSFKSEVREALEKAHVKQVPIVKHKKPLSESGIIQRLGGGDETEGSCASLAFAYAGQKSGYDVLDFRGGISREMFASHDRIREIANLPNVVSIINKSDKPMKDALKVLDSIVPGKEYYFTSCGHAAIVRKNSEGVLQYLELQSGESEGYTNGWHDFTNPNGVEQDIKETLKWRFGVPKTKSKYNQSTTLIDLDSLEGNKEFEKILEYINTNEAEQRKSTDGTIK